MNIKSPPPWKSYKVTKTNSRGGHYHDFQLGYWTYNVRRNRSFFRSVISIHRSTISARNTLCDRTTTDFKKILVKMFLFKLKTYFANDSLRQLVNTLHHFRCFQCSCGMQEVSHHSMFSHATKWFREQEFSSFNAQLLMDLGIRYPTLVIIDRYHSSKQSLRYASKVKHVIFVQRRKDHFIACLYLHKPNDALVAPALLPSL